MAPDGAECTCEKYGTFLNLFYPEVKWLIWRLEQIKDKIGGLSYSKHV